MVDLIVCDVRAARSIVSLSTARQFTVDDNWALSQFVGRVLSYAADDPDGIGMLDLWGHGICTDDHRKEATLGHGMEFCYDGVNFETVGQLAPLRDHVYQINVHACGFAHIADDRNGLDGDGNLLCCRMAMMLNCRVRASTAIQLGRENYHGLLSFPHWRGVVLTYLPDGSVQPPERNPL
jgi:hypothetical protein